MTKRKAISKKIRFDVFKRDLFACQYCGQKPPSVVLEVDHVNPVKNGGCNDEDNLVTACFDCNRGKGARTLDTSPETISKKMEVQAEKAEQLKSYEKMISAKKSAITRKVNKLDKKYIELTGDKFKFSATFKTSVKTFMEKMTYQDVEDALCYSFSRISDEDRVLRYFCGICWNKIKSGDQDG